MRDHEILRMTVHCDNGSYTHREKTDSVHLAFVAKGIRIREANAIPKAPATMETEWKKLWNIRCWVSVSAMEYEDVRRSAEAPGKIVHFGRVFPRCVETHRELPPDRRKFKGRAV